MEEVVLADQVAIASHSLVAAVVDGASSFAADDGTAWISCAENQVVLLPCCAFAALVPYHGNDPYFHSYTDGVVGDGGEDSGGHWGVVVGDGDNGGDEDTGGDSYSCRHWGAVDVGAGHAWADVAWASSLAWEA